MLIPALSRKKEVEIEFAKKMYTDDYFLYRGESHSFSIPKIEKTSDKYQWIMVDSDDKLVGYIEYTIDETDCVSRFGMLSFDEGNPLFGRELFGVMKGLLKHRRLEWLMLEGNPVKKHYDKFCQENGGSVFVLHKCRKDREGKLRDLYVYEILRNSKSDVIIV